MKITRRQFLLNSAVALGGVVTGQAAMAMLDATPSGTTSTVTADLTMDDIRRAVETLKKNAVRPANIDGEAYYILLHPEAERDWIEALGRLPANVRESGYLNG